MLHYLYFGDYTKSCDALSGLLPIVLDVKNDLLLSYLQNLVFLILLRLRNTMSDSNSTEADEEI